MVLTARHLSSRLISLVNGRHKSRIERYRTILNDIFTSSGKRMLHNLKMFVATIASKHCPLKVSRKMLCDFSKQISGCLFPKAAQFVSQYALQCLHDRKTMFKYQIAKLIYRLANIYEEKKEFAHTVKLLSRIGLEDKHSKLGRHFQVKANLRISRLYFTMNEPSLALPFLVRANAIRGVIEEDVLMLKNRRLLEEDKYFS